MKNNNQHFNFKGTILLQLQIEDFSSHIKKELKANLAKCTEKMHLNEPGAVREK